MSNSISAVIRDFTDKAGTSKPYISAGGGNVFPGEHGDGDVLYSYGSHFPLARIMPDKTGNRRGWWLLNGDRYSVSTSRHQSEVQSAVKRSGLPYMIVPSSALDRAGIKRDTITPVEIMPDRYTTETRTVKDMPLEFGHYRSNVRENDNGTWSYETQVHHLGEAVFTADFAYEEIVEQPYTDLKTYARVPAVRRWVRSTASFLSAFDDQEPGFGLYFLAQLPEGAAPSTVAEAFEALKPADVREYEMHGSPYGPVLRQGDVFAVPSIFGTRDLQGPSKRSEYVLGVNHLLTEVRVNAEGITYARGVMRHRPRETWRNPEHRSVKLGDGKQWFHLVRNTVPEGRSWSVGGNVD